MENRWKRSCGLSSLPGRADRQASPSSICCKAPSRNLRPSGACDVCSRLSVKMICGSSRERPRLRQVANQRRLSSRALRLSAGALPAARFPQNYRREREAMILPWTDIQDFGTTPKQYAYQEHTAEARLVAGSQDVALTPGPFAQQLKNGQGVCIWKAGPPTKQVTPAAPTAISPAVLGTLDKFLALATRRRRS
jgi:hypothetical protein